MSTYEPLTERARTALTKSVAFAAVIGLVAGLLAGWLISATRADTYVTATTYGLVPEGNSAEENMEPGQLTHLTPVVSSMATDPETIDAVETLLGRDPDVIFTPTLIADSPLLFRVQVEGRTPEFATTAARAMEETLPNMEKARSVMNGAGAELIVTASAPNPTSDLMVPTLAILLATGLAGALVGAGVVLAVSRNKQKI